jgi:hypothetical protein
MDENEINCRKCTGINDYCKKFSDQMKRQRLHAGPLMRAK